MLSVKQLKEMLSKYNENSEVVLQYNEYIVHIINLRDGRILLSNSKPIAYCKKCGGYVYPHDIKDYFGYCLECDESLYKFETESL